MVMILVILTSLVPAYGCLGFLPFFQRIGFGGLNSPKEIYGLAVYFGASPHIKYRSASLTPVTIGFVYGAFQAYARAFYAELIPRGEEAKWYALYSITDKVRSPSFSHLERDLTDGSVIFVCWSLSGRFDRRFDGKYTLRVLLRGLHDMARNSDTCGR